MLESSFDFERLIRQSSGLKDTPKQIAKRINLQLEALQVGFDPFDEDPELFNETDTVKFVERVIVNPETKELIKLWNNQKEDLQCKETRIAHQDGREVGKTVDIVGLAFKLGYTTVNKEYLLATPESQHLSTILLEIEKQIEATPAHKNYMTFKSTKEGHVYVDFPQGTRIHFRSGQSGNSFRGLHVHGIIVDEGQLMKHSAWHALLRCLKDDNGFVRIYGTPNGRRDTFYYRYTTDGSYHVFKFPSWCVPTWTKKKEEQTIKDCGGTNTQMWQNEVAGEHGQPVLAAFDADAMVKCLCEIEDYEIYNLFGRDFADITSKKEDSEEELRERIKSLLDLKHVYNPKYSYGFGGDLGYSTDPAELKVYIQDITGIWTSLFRIHTEKVSYPIIADIIAYLDGIFHFEFMGIDRGNNGLSVYQNLTELDKYKPHKFFERLYASDFNTHLLVGFDVDKKTGEEDEDKPLKKYAKEWATDLINEHFRNQSLVLSSADILQENQLVSQTCFFNGKRMIYSKGNDHINDEMRTFVLAEWLHREAPEIDGEETVSENVAIATGAGGW